MSKADARTHIVHVINRLGVGGMENVVVQLVNGLPPDRFRHSIIAITEVMPEIAARICHADVGLHALEKAPGQPFWRYSQMYFLLRRLKPDVWHSCNLAALEFSPVAWLAGVSRRIHAEHGLEIAELDGNKPAYLWLRRCYRNLVHAYVAVSVQIADYLQNRIGIDKDRVHLISNGVDLDLFRPLRAGDAVPEGYPFVSGQHWVVGTVGRQEAIKNPLLLVDAFIDLVHAGGPQASMLRLAMVGEGSQHEEIRQRMAAAGMGDRLWLPGNRDDVADIIRHMDCFVLPSISEGTSCTLQEAMASGVRIVATDVGGNRQVLDHGHIGILVPSGDCSALQAAISNAHNQDAREVATQMRTYAEATYSLQGTLSSYDTLFSKGCT